MAPTLEEDVLKVIWEDGSSLNVLEIKNKLIEKNIGVPFSVLNRNLGLLERAGILKVQSGYGWSKRYSVTLTQEEFELQPSEWLLSRCLCSAGLRVKLQFKLDIIRQILCLHRRNPKGENES